MLGAGRRSCRFAAVGGAAAAEVSKCCKWSPPRGFHTRGLATSEKKSLAVDMSKFLVVVPCLRCGDRGYESQSSGHHEGGHRRSRAQPPPERPAKE